MNELHKAAEDGSIERTVAVLSRGEVDIDQGGAPDGFTALMIAAFAGHSAVFRILLNSGADTARATAGGFTALHLSAQEGYVVMTKLLVKAGGDLEAAVYETGATPLHLASAKGRLGVMSVLIEAGANPNSRTVEGGTPLYTAAQYGHVNAVRVLLRAEANPLLTYSSPSGSVCVPLEVAAGHGHLEVVRELIQEHGIEGCGGATGGVDALQLAAVVQEVEIMGVLTSAGVVDSGTALLTAAFCGSESSVKFLLQQHELRASGEGAAYLNTRNSDGETPLVRSIRACCPRLPRIARMLVDVGADTTTAVRVTNARGVVVSDATPLATVDLFLSQESVGEEGPSEDRRHSLEATRRLLMRVEAVHAVSWLWPSDFPSAVRTEDCAPIASRTLTPLTRMLAILRRRTRRRGVLLTAMLRCSPKKS